MSRVHLLWIASAVLAAVVLVVYLDRDRSRVEGENAQATVLVAKQLIPNGTPGKRIVTKSMYAATTLPPDVVEVGAISDPAYLSGRTAVADIFPGEQLTATDFAVSDPALTGEQRRVGCVERPADGDRARSVTGRGRAVDITVSLTGSGNAHDGSVSATAIHTSNEPACSPAWFSFSPPDPGQFPNGANVSGGSPLNVTGTLEFVESGTLQDACSDATVTLDLAESPN